MSRISVSIILENVDISLDFTEFDACTSDEELCILIQCVAVLRLERVKPAYVIRMLTAL